MPGIRARSRNISSMLATIESNAHPAYVDALIAASADETVLTEAFSVGWPNAPHRVLRSSIEASARSVGDHIGETIGADGRLMPMPRFGASPPTKQTSGDIGAMALYAGTSVDAVTHAQSAADVVAELTAGLS